MKVVELINKKRELLAKHQFEIKEWLSPSMREHWHDFLAKIQKSYKNQEHNEDALPLAANQQLNAQTQALVQEVAPAPSRATSVNMNEATEAEFHKLSAQVGQETHLGDWLLIDQARIDQFADVTMDHQWVHTNPERAALESPFKTTIAHGFLTLSLIPVLSDSVNPENPQHPDAKMVVNYGLNQVRFPYPLKVNSKVRARTKLLSVTPISRGLELVKEIKIEIEGCRRPACVAETVIRLYF